MPAGSGFARPRKGLRLMDGARNEREWAELLQKEWEERARSSARDFFIASAPGWQEPEAWAEQARCDVAGILQGLEPSALAASQVLDVGCGVGRLVPYLAPLTAGYTGFDLAPGMIAEARARCRGIPRARFFVSDGLGVPAAALDRRYGLALALAVFIHCPAEVIGPLAASVYRALAPGGQFRFQVFTDYRDWESFEDYRDMLGRPLEVDIAALRASVRDGEAAAPPEALRLLEGSHYEGHRFPFSEVGAFFEAATGGEVEVFRPHPVHAHGILRKPA